MGESVKRLRDMFPGWVGRYFRAVTVLVTMGPISVSAESVSYRQLDSGVMEFQIHDGQEGGKYVLELSDAAVALPPVRIEKFSWNPLTNVWEARWKPLIKSGLFRAAVSRDGKPVFQAVELKASPLGEMKTTLAEIDRLEKELLWSTGAPAIARVIAQGSSGMALELLEPWHFSGGGRQRLSWNFRAANGVDFIAFPGLDVLVQYAPLPAGWIVIGRPGLAKSSDLSEHLTGLPTQTFGFAVALENRDPTTKEPSDAPILREGTLLRVTLDEPTRKLLEGRRFEILVYINGEFIHEESQGVSPYRFVFPKLEGWKGRQNLTVNVLDYEGNFGTRTLPVQVSGN